MNVQSCLQKAATRKVEVLGEKMRSRKWIWNEEMEDAIYDKQNTYRQYLQKNDEESNIIMMKRGI